MTDPGGTVHLVDAASAGGFASPALRALLRDPRARGHRVVALGHDAADRWADHGVAAWARLGAPLGRPALAHRPLRRMLARWGRVWAWSGQTLLAARLAGAGGRLSAALCLPPSDGPWGNLERRALSGVGGRVVFGGSADAASWGEAHAEVLPTPAVCASEPATSRAALRERWGCGDALVTAFLAPHPVPADARAGMFVLGALTLADRGVFGVAGPSHGVERGLRLAERFEGRWTMLVEIAPVEEWIHGCDAALWVPRPSPWSAALRAATRPPMEVLAASARGVPVIVRAEPDAPAWATWPGVIVARRGPLALAAGELAGLDTAQRRAGTPAGDDASCAAALLAMLGDPGPRVSPAARRSRGRASRAEPAPAGR